jgi:tagaturonate reductase
MALGFAAFLLFMKCHSENGGYVGRVNDATYPVQDDCAEYFAAKWKDKKANEMVDSVLSDKEFWQTDLTSRPGFADAVKGHLDSLLKEGALTTIRRLELNKTIIS